MNGSFYLGTHDDGRPRQRLAEDSTLTLDAARDTVTVELETHEGTVTASYEVVDFYFLGEGGGCWATGERSPATPLGLALLALVAWRRKASRADR